MLYRAGFAGVYRVAEMPDHEKIDEPRDVVDPWSKTAISIDGGSIAGRIWRFLRRPWRAQYISLAYKARRVVPEKAMPLRVAFGGWGLVQKRGLGGEVVYGGIGDGGMGFCVRLWRP